MEFRLFTVEEITILHDRVLNSGELEGLAGDKSLEGALGRVDFIVQFGMIEDAYDLASMYAVAISQAHVFNDANKRTAYTALELCFAIHNIRIEFNTEEVGDIIRNVAQAKMDEVALARWLREHPVS